MTLWTKCKALFHKFSFRKTKRWIGALFYCLVVVISIVGRVFLPVDGSFSVLALVWWILLWGAIEGKAYIPRKYLVRFSAHPLFQRIRRYRWDQLKGNVSQEIVIEIAACKNCGHTYVGTYCPQCGQHRATYRFTKGSIVADVFKSFFNLDRGLGATLLALLYRPGYMIRQYLAGKRVHYFRPFQLLFLLATIYYIGMQIVQPVSALDVIQIKDLSTSTSDVSVGTEKEDALFWIAQIDALYQVAETTWKAWGERMPLLKNTWELLSSLWEQNKALNIIPILPLFSWGAYLVFKKKKGRKAYNFTEHCIIQTYISCQLLFVSLWLLFLREEQEVGVHFSFWAFTLSAYDYRQLFGLTWWQALKKTLLLYLTTYGMMLLLFLCLFLMVWGVWFLVF